MSNLSATAAEDAAKGRDATIKPPGPRSLIKRLLDFLFPYESMSGRGACPVYLERWELFSFGTRLECYLHHFIGDDWALDPHDHPRRFVSIGLRGWYFEDVFEYVEATKELVLIETIKHRAPWVRSFPATHIHRVRAKECGDCWTLVFVLKKERAWGFWKDHVWLPFKKYVFGSDAHGKPIYRKDC